MGRSQPWKTWRKRFLGKDPEIRNTEHYSKSCKKIHVAVNWSSSCRYPLHYGLSPSSQASWNHSCLEYQNYFSSLISLEKHCLNQDLKLVIKKKIFLQKLFFVVLFCFSIIIYFKNWKTLEGCLMNAFACVCVCTKAHPPNSESLALFTRLPWHPSAEHTAHLPSGWVSLVGLSGERSL